MSYKIWIDGVINSWFTEAWEAIAVAKNAAASKRHLRVVVLEDGDPDDEGARVLYDSKGKVNIIPEPTDPSQVEESPTFEEELTNLINRYSLENGSDTPDFILANYLMGCLDVWNAGVRRREKWYGRSCPDCQSDDL